ncbi:uncharacterized protein GO595_009495 [Histomonas meleagridis]|uniref:uncharacterized protein n=1 Tax=Histomonas meleagridis TaxID=135588 RepID=UPI00355A64EB|nr:hypothetical protein GO595_009645 [Histomonas meleagridis]KAH0797866.1 hypothetical protein GO595_009495 [Histomonas meleagridis]
MDHFLFFSPENAATCSQEGNRSPQPGGIRILNPRDRLSSNDSEDLLTLPTPVDSTPSPAHSTPLGASISPKLSPEALEEDIIYAADKTAFDHLKKPSKCETIQRTFS